MMPAEIVILWNKWLDFLSIGNLDKGSLMKFVIMLALKNEQ